MFKLHRLATIFSAIALSFTTGMITILNAQETPYFRKSPRLIDYSTTRNITHVWGATYYFTITLPDDLGAPLQQIQLIQKEGVDFESRYADDTKVFRGTRSDRGENLPLDTIEIDSQKRTITLTFEPPITPGTTITVGLRPFYTPSIGGVYLWRVNALPPGGEDYALSLGVARFHFRDDRGWF